MNTGPPGTTSTSAIDFYSMPSVVLPNIIPENGQIKLDLSTLQAAGGTLLKVVAVSSTGMAFRTLGLPQPVAAPELAQITLQETLDRFLETSQAHQIALH